MPGPGQFNEVYAQENSQTFLAADAVAAKIVFDPAPYMGRVDAIVATSTDVVDHYLTLSYNNVTATGSLGTVKVPAGAGYGAVPAVDVIAGLPASIQTNLTFGLGSILYGFLDTAVTAAFEVDVTAVGGTL